MAGRSAQEWDDRYAARGWLTEPSSTVLSAVQGLAAGRAVDLAAGTGRHSRWLATQGWTVTAVDFSAVGITQGRARSTDVTWVVADALIWQPDEPVDLVLAAYVQLGVDGFRRAAGWLASGGRLVVVGHAGSNLPAGRHGPRDPALLHTPEALREAATGMWVERLEQVVRPDEGGSSVDLVLVARAPARPLTGAQ